MGALRASDSFAGRLAVLVYGVFCYLIGVGGLVCIILALATLLPYGFLESGPTGMPVVWNLGLVALWGAIHTIMARDRFKGMITRMIPEAAERPTYVLVAGITSILLVGLWQEVSGVVWSVSNSTGATALWALFAFGWSYTLVSTFAINHFDLFGLRQVYLHFTQKPRPPLAFVKRAMYRFSRHPIQTGVLIGVWATPEMTVTQLLLSAGFTGYVFVGLWYEEKDLVRDIGAPYEQYRKEAGKLLPKFRSSS